MKVIEAIIKPFRLEEVQGALLQAGVQGMTVIEMKEFSHRRGPSGTYEGQESALKLVLRVKIQFTVTDGQFDRVIAILRSAKGGSSGKDKIFVRDQVPATTDRE